MVKARGGERVKAPREVIPPSELAELKASQLIAVVSALISTFLLALYIRLYPAYMWGLYINEFDPYIRYYLTEFMLKLGVVKGIEWWLSGGVLNGHVYINHNFWYPWGANWATTLSPGVSFFGLILYDILVKHLHLNISLLEIAVYGPGIVNALAVFSMYYLGSRIGGKYVGLLTALFAAFSIVFTQRGTASWYADATLFQFIAPLGMALFIEAFRQRNWIPYAILSAIVNGSTVWFWGSFAFLLNSYGAFAILASIYILYRLYRGRVVPMGIGGIATDPYRVLGTYILTYLGFASFLAMTPRYRLHSLLGLGSLATLAAILVVFALIVYALSRLGMKAAVKASLYVLVAGIAFVAVVAGLALSGIPILVHIPGGKYLGALLPTSRSALVQSVAEHSPSTAHQMLATTGYTLPFEVLGMAYTLSTMDMGGLLASTASAASIYFASSEAWLTMLMFSWFPIAAYGFAWSLRMLARRRISAAMLIVLTLIVAIFALSTAFVAESGVPLTVAPQQIVSTTSPAIPSSDWIDALYWIQFNTPKNAVIDSWWDYGYWLAILGNKTSLADNSTVNGTQIARIAEAFVTDNATKSLEILHELGANYVVVFLPYYVIPNMVPSPTASFAATAQSSYIPICGLFPEYPTGGDFVKSYWMGLISGHSPGYVNSHLLNVAYITSRNPSGGTTTVTIYVPLSNATIYKLMFNIVAHEYTLPVYQCLLNIRSYPGYTPFTIPVWYFNTWLTLTPSQSSSSSAVTLLENLVPVVGVSSFIVPFVGTNVTALNNLYGLWYVMNWVSPPPGFKLVYVSRPNGWVLVYKVDYGALGLNETKS